MTGPLSGHLKVLVQNYVEALGSKNHFVYDLLASKVNRSAAEKLYGISTPHFQIAKAKLILSFGADFLNTWESPVHFSAQYAEFRKANDGKPRGVLIQAEPKMTLTGANADRWIAIKPGSEGVFALGLVNALLEDARYSKNVPASIADAVRKYDKARVSRETGVSEEVFGRVLTLLRERSPEPRSVRTIGGRACSWRAKRRGDHAAQCCAGQHRQDGYRACENSVPANGSGRRRYRRAH